MGNLLQVRRLATHFFMEDGVVRAVDNVSFNLAGGESLGLVGESGCGKSVTALSLLRLVEPPGWIVGGEVLLRGHDLLALPEPDLRRVRGGEIGMVFQEPATALNPVLTIGAQVAEAVRAHHRVSRRDAWERAIRALEQAALPDAPLRARDFPHQLSGGLRQRAMIAMALAAGPRLLVADEPTTALDVTIQAQILDLLRHLRDRLGLAVLLITHDLGVVAETCDRVAIMYAGRIVEAGATRDLLARPLHPYTRGLLTSRTTGPPAADPGGRLPAIPGSVPDLLRLPAGCAFAPRCPDRLDRCLAEAPSPETVAPDRQLACHLRDGDGQGEGTASEGPR